MFIGSCFKENVFFFYRRKIIKNLIVVYMCSSLEFICYIYFLFNSFSYVCLLFFLCDWKFFYFVVGE